jgi:hypothetical protein
VPRVRLPLPSPRSRYNLYALNSQVLRDWEALVRVRAEVCTRCWDHLASKPGTVMRTRYLPLGGTMSSIEIDGVRLPQWQYEIDRGVRLKVALAADHVIVIAVSQGQPIETE